MGLDSFSDSQKRVEQNRKILEILADLDDDLKELSTMLQTIQDRVWATRRELSK